jgi:hypothetical protein
MEELGTLTFDDVQTCDRQRIWRTFQWRGIVFRFFLSKSINDHIALYLRAPLTTDVKILQIRATLMPQKPWNLSHVLAPCPAMLPENIYASTFVLYDDVVAMGISRLTFKVEFLSFVAVDEFTDKLSLFALKARSLEEELVRVTAALQAAEARAKKAESADAVLQQLKSKLAAAFLE